MLRITYIELLQYIAHFAAIKVSGKHRVPLAMLVMN